MGIVTGTLGGLATPSLEVEMKKQVVRRGEETKKLVFRREELRYLVPPTLEDEDLDKVVGGTQPGPPRDSDPDIPMT